MSGLEVKSVGEPDEVRQFANGHGHADIVSIGGQPVLFGTFEPGWKWSEDVKPIAGTDSCQTNHLGYIISGRLHIVMDDGTEHECGPGDIFAAAPGHDAWVVGDEPCVSVDFGQVEMYAKA